MFDNVKCIIFDCDGVLVDSERIGIATLLEMAAPLGYAVSYESAMIQFKGIALQTQFEIIESATGQKLPADFETQFRALSFRNFRTHLKPISGAVDFVNGLAIPFCVASNGPAEKIKLNLHVAGFGRLFDGHIFSGYDIGKWKPDSEVFLHAAKTMGFSPAECIVIDDSDAGITAAVNGGFPVVGFCKPIPAHDIVFTTDFSQIYSLLPTSLFK